MKLQIVQHAICKVFFLLFLVNFPCKQTNSNTCMSSRTNIPHTGLIDCIVLSQSCVWWAVSRGMGQCAAACFLSIFLRILIFSPELIAAAYSSCPVWEDLHLMLGLEKQRSTLSIFSVVRFFISSFTCRAASVSLILFTGSLQTQRCTGEEKGLHSLDKVSKTLLI